jgi:hypothetical protein
MALISFGKSAKGNPQPPIMDLRLVSYNVNGLPWNSPPIHSIVAWIVQNSNLAAIQEIWINHAEWAAAFATHGWSFLRPSREHHFATLFGSGLAFAWPTGRWRLQDARQYPFLDRTIVDMFATKSWFQLELIDPLSNRPFRVINTHMQSDIDCIERFTHPHVHNVRLRQSRQLVASLKHQEQKPTLIVGDINTERCPFVSYSFLQKDTTPTYPIISRILDHCVSRPEDEWILREHRVADVDWSDHRPVLWNLSL